VPMSKGEGSDDATQKFRDLFGGEE
jgi:hypothetical protein